MRWRHHWDDGLCCRWSGDAKSLGSGTQQKPAEEAKFLPPHGGRVGAKGCTRLARAAVGISEYVGYMPNLGSTCSRNSENGPSLFLILRKSHLKKTPGLARLTSGKRSVCLSVGESIGGLMLQPTDLAVKWHREISPTSHPE